jgi:hypothetical protein
MNRSRWAWYAVGTATACYGTYGLITAGQSNPVAWARFAAIVVIANDGLLVPLILLAGAALLRAPRRARVYLQSGLVISGVATLVALPLLLGFGRSADLPSALPLNYGRGLAITLFVVWLGIGAVAATRLAPRVLALLMKIQ